MRLFDLPVELMIFDVDDVIIDTFETFKRNFIDVTKELGLPLRPLREYFEEIEANQIQPITEICATAYYIWPCLSRETINRFVLAYEKRSVTSKYTAIPESVETLKWLYDSGVFLAICSNATRSSVLRRFEVTGISLDWFHVISTIERGIAKPNPLALEGIFKKISVSPRHSWFVGDMTTDFFTANGAGIKFIGVLTGFTSKDAFMRAGAQENYILQKMSDIRHHVKMQEERGENNEWMV